MGDRSLVNNCFEGFAFKSLLGGSIGLLTSVLFKSEKRLFIIYLCAGLGGGLASRDCDQFISRLKYYRYPYRNSIP